MLYSDGDKGATERDEASLRSFYAGSRQQRLSMFAAAAAPAGVWKGALICLM